MSRSPLHHASVALGARFTEFAGWEMPARYESVLAEHRAVRAAAGLFDISHLGRFELTGRGGRRAARRLLCNDIDRVEPGRCQYTMILNENGGIIDDMIVWRWGAERFWVMPNAASHDRVMGTFAAEPGCAVTDLRATTAMIALQGPAAPAAFEGVLGAAPGRFRCATIDWGGSETAMAGVGYTGEAGGEIVTEPGAGAKLIGALVEAGARPCGLGARDTLRLESGLPLLGPDIDETTTPLEAGLGFAVSMCHDFVGKAALARQQADGAPRRLTGLILEDRVIPRPGHRARTSGGGEGVVTSGNISPLLETGVGLAYIAPPPDKSEAIEVRIRGRWAPGRLAEPPFHKA